MSTSGLLLIPPVLLSLAFGVGVFHEFFLIDFVGVSYCRDALQRRTLTPQQVA